MRYFLYISVVLSLMVSYFTFSFAISDTSIHIISRAEWGADESLRYADSPVWKTANTSYLQYLARPKTQSELDEISSEDKRIAYIQEHSLDAGEVVERRYSESGHPLMAPLQKTKQVNRIIIHHSDNNMDSTRTDSELIRDIYYNHTITKGWGDIAYNYIIGQRGDIYEGRAGGDYVVGTHALSNNLGSVGVMMLGNFERDHLNTDQIAGMERLIPFLAKKYGISLSGIVPGYSCTTGICTLTQSTALLGHRDVRATDCPGKYLYPFIATWIAKFDTHYTPVLNQVHSIEPIPQDRIMNLSLRQEPMDLASTINTRGPVVAPTRYIGPKFRVRLSYPDPMSVVISTADNKIGKLTLDNQKIQMQSSQKVQVGIVGNNKLTVQVGERSYTGSVLRLAHTVVRIDSWNRVPDWDKNRKYNDNMFRDTIRVIAQDNKLVAINDLPIDWYLKGMGEVSNGDLTEKIKTIVVSARSYARWYMDPRNRKFAGEPYDGSDDPDVFQKYLGYSYELRSPSIAKMVDVTHGQVITYSGQLIKPWYHSSSDGRTLSVLEYCQNNGGKNCVDTPYLQSVVDPGSEGKTRSGHGVGISGAGATYWAQAGWDYAKIIQYYLKGVEIQKK